MAIYGGLCLMSVLKKLTEAEIAAQAAFKLQFEIPHSENLVLIQGDLPPHLRGSRMLEANMREIVRLTEYFDEYKDDRFFRQQYKKAWTDAGYSEYVFEYYRLKTIDGAVTVFCEEDAGA